MPLTLSDRCAPAPPRSIPRSLRLAGAGSLLAASLSAAAAPTCAVTATPVVFGNYDSLAASPTNANGSVTVSCTIVTGLPGAIPYTLSLGPSQTSGTMQRRLAGPTGGDLLPYNIYTDIARSVIWGDGSGGSQAITSSVTPASVGVPATRTHTAYGSIPARQSVRAGAYSDAILVTVDY